MSKHGVARPGLITCSRTAVPGVGGPAAFASFRLNSDGIDQTDVTPSFNLVTALFHLVLHLWREEFLHPQLVWKPLVMESRGIDCRLSVHPKPHPIQDRKERHGNNCRPAGGTCYKAQLTVSQNDSGCHGAQRPLARS